MAFLKGGTGLQRLDTALLKAVQAMPKGYRAYLGEGANFGYTLRVVEWCPKKREDKKESRIAITPHDLKLAGYDGPGIADMLAKKVSDCIDHIAGTCKLHDDCRWCAEHVGRAKKSCPRCAMHLDLGKECVSGRGKVSA